MRAAVLTQYGAGFDHIAVQDRPTPKPEADEVLVRIAASPINPSDLQFLTGRYGLKKHLPAVPGFEASGLVVATGSGFRAKMLLDKRVACASQGTGDGVWAQYAVIPAMQCLPLASNINDEQGATVLINPFTARALIGMAREHHARTIVQTAAGSALGHMIWRLGKRFEIDVIGIVRRPEQAEELRAQGMRVFCTADADMDRQLAVVCRLEKVSMVLDAVAGETGTRVLQSLAPGGSLIVYGGLSLRNPSLTPSDLIFAGKSIKGFWLTKWFKKRGLAALMFDAPRVQRLIETDLRTQIQGRYGLNRIAEALADYTAHMSEGKVLLLPHKIG
jgi:NADPH:quinone reductase-like Zn-dependent oxidoreductase